MHETTFVNEIFSVVKDKLNKDKTNNVVSVNVKLSPLSHVSKEGLLDTYQELAKGSGFERIRLNIEPLGVLLSCHHCKNTSTISKPAFKCPLCDSDDIELNFDKEFIIESIEIDKQENG